MRDEQLLYLISDLAWAWTNNRIHDQELAVGLLQLMREDDMLNAAGRAGDHASVDAYLRNTAACRSRTQV